MKKLIMGVLALFNLASCKERGEGFFTTPEETFVVTSVSSASSASPSPLEIFKTLLHQLARKKDTP